MAMTLCRRIQKNINLPKCSEDRDATAVVLLSVAWYKKRTLRLNTLYNHFSWWKVLTCVKPFLPCLAPSAYRLMRR